jgi:hypothetical protein
VTKSGVLTEGFTPQCCAKFVLEILTNDRIRWKPWNQ